MALNTNDPRAEYIAASGQTIFPFLFKVYNDTDIVAYLTPVGVDPDDTADLLTLTTEYTVSINGDDGGSITLVSGATTGDAITILRNLPVDRNIEYQTSGDLLAETLNDDQEYQTYLIADQVESGTRYIKLSENSQGVDGTLPSPNASEYLRWNEDGTALENVGVVAESAVGATVSLDTTNFDLNLGATDDNVQTAMETLDELVSGAGATGGGTDEIFYENGQTITTNYTLTAGKNAMTAGTVTINDGVTVTIPDGASWSIV